MVKVLLLTLVVAFAAAFPTKDELMIESPDGDTAVVESKIREVRAIGKNHVPAEVKDLLAAGGKGAYIHTYGDGEGDAHGFHRKAEEQGSDGYEHFDSYHKKDSDKYGYEKRSEFGKGEKASSASVEGGEKYQDVGKDKEDYTQNNNEEEEGDETKHSYKVVEDVDEDDGSSAQYTAGSDYDESDHAGYTDAGDGGESSSYSYSSTDGDGAHYTSGDSGNAHHTGDQGHYAEGGSSSEHYSEGSQDGDGESEHYTSEGGEY